MISGASEEELEIANDRADLLLEIQDLQQRITRAIEYIGNKNIGIPRKTREKAIAILGGKE